MHNDRTPQAVGDQLESRVWDAVSSLCEALLVESETDPARSGERSLLFAHRFLVDRDKRWKSAAVRHLNVAIDSADALHSTGRWGLYGGLAGLGWVVEGVSRIVGEGEGDDLNAVTDRALLRELERGRWRGSCDLECGLAGIGVYFLERVPAHAATASVKLVVDHLASIGESGRLFPAKLECDVARGLPGVMHFLAEAVTAGIEVETARRLLERSIEALSVHECHEQDTAAVMLRCARTSGRNRDRELATTMLQRAAAAPTDDASIATASLRNGTAGKARAFRRMYESEGDPRCLEIERAWLERTLLILRQGRLAAELEGDEFLDGQTGVALTLLTASSSVDPSWDRRLALSGSLR